MGNTSFADALDGIYDVLKAWPAFATGGDFADVFINDGELDGSFSPQDMILVGFNDEGPCVEGAQRPAELGQGASTSGTPFRREGFVIHNTVTVYDGSTETRAARRRLANIFYQVEDCLRQHSDFAGDQTFSDIRAFNYSQDITEDGVACTLQWGVTFNDYGRRF